MRYVFSIALLVLLTSLSRGQYVLPEVDTAEVLVPKLSVKYVPSKLVGHFPSHMVGVELRVKNNISIETRVGKILNQEVLGYDPTYYFNKSGFKSSLAVKYYFDRSDYQRGTLQDVFSISSSDLGFRPYFAFEAFFNEMNYDRKRTFELNCGDGCNYFTQITYGLNQKRWGGRLHVGFITKVAGPIFLDCSVAGGFMSRNTTADSRKPLNFEREYGYRLVDEYGSNVVPALDLNIQLMIQLLR